MTGDLEKWLSILGTLIKVAFIIVTLPLRILQMINCYVAHDEYMCVDGYYIDYEFPAYSRVDLYRCAKCGFYWHEFRPAHKLPKKRSDEECIEMMRGLG